MANETPCVIVNPPHANGTSPALSKQRQREFLAEVRRTGRVMQSCHRCGISSSQPYDWASKSNEFAKRFEAAKLRGEKVLLDTYEDLIDKRAETGPLDPQSAVLTMFRTKRLDPRYRENAQVAIISGPVQITFGVQPANVVENGTTPQGMVEGRVDNDPHLEKR